MERGGRLCGLRLRRGRPTHVPERRRRGLVGTVVALLAVGGCSGGDEPFTGSPIAPVASPSATIVPVRPVPVGDRTITGSGYTLGVPGQWEERRRVLSGHGEVARWAEPRAGSAPTMGVAVVVDDKPATPMLDQSYDLEQRLAADGLPVVRSTMVRTDVEQPAILVQWDEKSRGDGRRRTVWQLFVQSRSGRIINLVGYAPAETFLTSVVPKVMGTLEVTS